MMRKFHNLKDQIQGIKGAYSMPFTAAQPLMIPTNTNQYALYLPPQSTFPHVTAGPYHAMGNQTMANLPTPM